VASKRSSIIRRECTGEGRGIQRKVQKTQKRA